MIHHGPYEQLRRGLSAGFFGACVASAGAIIVVLGLVAGYLIFKGGSSLSLEFFTGLPTGDANNPGGMKHAIVGTLVLTLLAAVIGVPVGLMAGVYLCEFAAGASVWEKRLAAPVRFVADVLAGVPSIVVGLLGYELLVVPIGHFNGWAGALALAFIMVPIVARTSEEMLKLVPDSYRAASLALGATRAQTILRVVLPSATGSIITGVMLGLARIAGETAPLLFTALGSRLLSVDPNQPFPSLTVQIYTYATGPYEPQKRLAWAGMLVLVVGLFALNLLTRAVTRGRR
jgi:phosphate transport system permease protein